MKDGPTAMQKRRKFIDTSEKKSVETAPWVYENADVEIVAI